MNLQYQVLQNLEHNNSPRTILTTVLHGHTMTDNNNMLIFIYSFLHVRCDQIKIKTVVPG